MATHDPNCPWGKDVPLGDICDCPTDQLIGKTFEEGSAFVAEAGLILRICEQDGKFVYGTDDYNPNRLDVVLQNGVIVETRGFG